MGKSKKDASSHPLDVALGNRIRLRRRELGLSQERLAKKVGVTFQQVQKYEHGTNRVSFSRLVDIASALDITVEAFVEGLQQRRQGMATKVVDPDAAEWMEALSGLSPTQQKLVRALIAQMRTPPVDEPEED